MLLRKLFGASEAKPDAKVSVPSGMAPMGANLQKKFAKGIQYNSKYYTILGKGIIAYL